MWSLVTHFIFIDFILKILNVFKVISTPNMGLKPMTPKNKSHVLYGLRQPGSPSDPS